MFWFDTDVDVGVVPEIFTQEPSLSLLSPPKD